MTNKNERNARIETLYVGGMTYADIGAVVGVSKARVAQIVKKMGIHRPEKTGGKDVFLGVNLPPAVKTALKKEADRRGLPMSDFTRETMRDTLMALGYALEADNL